MRLVGAEAKPDRVWLFYSLDLPPLEEELAELKEGVKLHFMHVNLC